MTETLTEEERHALLYGASRDFGAWVAVDNRAPYEALVTKGLVERTGRTATHEDGTEREHFIATIAGMHWLRDNP